MAGVAVLQASHGARPSRATFGARRVAFVFARQRELCPGHACLCAIVAQRHGGTRHDLPRHPPPPPPPQQLSVPACAMPVFMSLHAIEKLLIAAPIQPARYRNRGRAWSRERVALLPRSRQVMRRER